MRKILRLGESGVALVLTVWLLTILAVVVAEFLFTTRLRLKADRNVRQGVKSYALALSGYHAALDSLDEGLTGVDRDDEGRLLLYRSRDDEGVPAEVKDIPLEGGGYSYIINDEDGKIDINRQNRPVLVALLRKSGLEMGAERDTLVDSILDWRDTNREHRLNGAEEDFYRSLERPYSCKDGPFDVIEELLLVRGMEEDYFFGGEHKGKTFLGLRDWITVFPVTFNPQTATKEVQEIMGRAGGRSRSQLSRYFTVIATGRAGDNGLERNIKAVVLRAAQGRKITFELLYWNDNYFQPRRDAVVP